MSDERLDIHLRPANEKDSPDIVRELVNAVNELIPASSEGGSKWIRGKGEQEIAKAAEVKAKILTRLSDLENERQRLILERQQAEETARQTRKAEKNRHGERQYELETQRISAEAEALRKKSEALKEAVAAIKELKSLAIEVSIEVLIAKLLPV